MLWAHFALCARAPARPRRTSRRGSHTPLAERRAPAHAQSGGPAQVHTPLAGRRRDSLPRWAGRRGCTLPYGRRVAGRAVEGGPAGARSLTGGATPDCRGGRAGGCTLPCGRRDAGLPWRADRRGCTLPCGRRDAGLPWRADRRGCTLPYGRRDARLPWRADRRGCTLPYGRRVAGRAVEGGPAGARSLTGGAWPVALWRADRRGCTLPCGRRGT